MHAGMVARRARIDWSFRTSASSSQAGSEQQQQARSNSTSVGAWACCSVTRTLRAALQLVLPLPARSICHSCGIGCFTLVVLAALVCTPSFQLGARHRVEAPLPQPCFPALEWRAQRRLSGQKLHRPRGWSGGGGDGGGSADPGEDPGRDFSGGGRSEPAALTPRRSSPRWRQHS